MRQLTRRTWVLVPLLTLAISICGYAQEASSFEQLQLLVQPGDKIYVRGAAGETIEGRVQELSTSTLNLTGKFGVRSLAQADISEIRKWRYDSLKTASASVRRSEW